MSEPHAKKGGNGRTLLLLAGGIGLLFLASAVLGALRFRDSARSLANKKSVLFVSDCIGALRAGDEPHPCAGSPRTKVFVAGRDETREGDLRALDSGSRLSFTVEAASDDVTSVGCKIDLLGYRRTLVQKKGRDAVTCEATVP